jgi:hypothetical protein
MFFFFDESGDVAFPDDRFDAHRQAVVMWSRMWAAGASSTFANETIRH